MKKIIYIPVLVLILNIVFTTHVYATCPVCTVAIGAGLGLSRLIGIDDVVSSLWIGGFLLSLSLWIVNWLEAKYRLKTKFRYLDLLAVAGTYLISLFPLSLLGIIGHPFNKLWGMDKIVLGVVIGSLGVSLGDFLDKKVREIKGKRLFDFQRVIFPVLILFVLSIIFYFITR
jgi:hypothetical protein